MIYGNMKQISLFEAHYNFLSPTLEKSGSVHTVDGQLPFRQTMESTNSESSSNVSPGASMRIWAMIDELGREIWSSVGMTNV